MKITVVLNDKVGPDGHNKVLEFEDGESARYEIIYEGCFIIVVRMKEHKYGVGSSVNQIVKRMVYPAHRIREVYVT